MSILYLNGEDNPANLKVTEREPLKEQPETVKKNHTFLIVFGLPLLLLSGACLLYRKKLKRVFKKIFSFFIIIVLFFSVSKAVNAEVIKDVSVTDKGISVTVIFDGLLEKNVPLTYLYRHTDGKDYELPLIKIKYSEGKLKNRRETIRGRIDYGQTLFIPKPPVSISYSYTDDVSEQTVDGTVKFVSLVQKEPFSWKRSNDMAVIFEFYESALYLMRDTKNIYVPYNDERPEINRVENEIVKAMGLDSDRIRITGAEWSGSVYTENGIEKRKAVFTVEHFTAHYVAYYEEVWDLPEAKGIRATATYGSSLDLTENRIDTKTSPLNVFREGTSEDTGAETSSLTDSDVTMTLLTTPEEDMRATAVTVIIAVSGGLLLLLTALFFILKTLKKKKKA